MERGANISADGVYRYSLWRAWDARLSWLCFVMLNPSVADANIDDPTIRRCIGFADQLGYGGIQVVNLFAYRATDPRLLKQTRLVPDPIGPRNNHHILMAAMSCQRTVCAWGNHGAFGNRGATVLDLLKERDVSVHALRVSLTGHPCHPLYLPYSCQLIDLN